MKTIKVLNIKKTFKSLKTGVLSTNIFFFLFAAFFSTLALAAALTLTHKDNRIPNGASGCFSSKVEQGETTFVELDNDRTEDLRDVIWSDDGTMVFSINEDMGRTDKDFGDLDLSMNKVRDPFELNTVKTFLGTHTCDDIDGFDVDHPDFQAQGMTTVTTGYTSIHAAKGGKIFYILSDESELYRYDLSTPFDFSTANYVQELTLTPDGTTGDGSSSIQGFSVSRDGTRLFVMDHGDDLDTPLLKTFSLSPAFDITSATEIHSVNLYDDLGVADLAGNQAFRDVEFSHDGSAMFISVLDVGDGTRSGIHQFSLGKNFDVSSASHLGLKKILYRLSPGGALRDGTGSGAMWGFSFSSDGMKLFFVQAGSGQVVDNIYQFDLECPYGIVSCVSNASASVNAQVELAKQNITQNISVIFKRFEWIKRNRDNEDFPSHDITINYPNPLLKSLVSKFEPSFKNNLAALVRNTEKKEKKSKWSSWSLADISISNLSKNGFENAKNIRSEGLTFGFDRKFGDNKFLGWALRYGDSKSNIHNSKQNTDLESLTFNLYGIVPTNENRYINVVLGLSALRYDNKYLGKLSSKRTGRQAFTSINYRTQNTYGKFNLTPTGKFTLGVTRLSDYTDFISTTINGPTTDVKYAEDTFGSGEVAAGFLFDIDKMEVDKGTLQPMGGIEILYDLTPNVDYKYKLQGATPVNRETIIGSYSKRSLKTNIGFELIYLNGFTISPSYEKIMSLSDNERIPGERKKTYSEKFIIKLSRSKEEKGSEFAFDFDPLTNDSANLSYVKDIGNFNLKLNSNYSSINRISDYGANIELSGTF